MKLINFEINNAEFVYQLDVNNSKKTAGTTRETVLYQDESNIRNNKKKLSLYFCFVFSKLTGMNLFCVNSNTTYCNINFANSTENTKIPTANF